MIPLVTKLCSDVQRQAMSKMNTDLLPYCCADVVWIDSGGVYLIDNNQEDNSEAPELRAYFDPGFNAHKPIGHRRNRVPLSQALEVAQNCTGLQLNAHQFGKRRRRIVLERPYWELNSRWHVREESYSPL